MTDQAFRERFHYDSDKDLIGSGGFGSVYRAYDNTEKRYVALKISQVKDIYGKFTLLNEVELSKRIDDHTNVARYEFGFRLKYPFPVDYAIMAYYEEGNLDMVLRKRFGQLTDKEYYQIVEGLLKGIGHLHNENIIHRDLKLANILMLRTRQGHWRPKIADFGLSRQIDDIDASIANSAIGITIAYAAPEQIEGGLIRKNVDLWALGVIVYRLLTGEMPFAATQNTDPTNANLEMSRKITQVELPEKLSTVPEPYQTIVKLCFVKDTKERPQTAGELLDILKRFIPDSNSWRDTTTNSSADKSPIRPMPSFDEPIPTTEIATPSVPKPIVVPKMDEIIEENTQVEMPAMSNPFTAPVIEAETMIEPQPAPKSTTTSTPKSAPKSTTTTSKSTPKKVIDDSKTLIEPQSEPKKVIDDSKTLIETHSTPKFVVDENKTLIETRPVAQSKGGDKKALPNKRKMFIGAGILAVLLSFGICKMIKPTDTNAAVNPSNETAELVSNPSTDVSIGGTTQPNTTPTPTTTSPTAGKVDNTAQTAKPGQGATPTPSTSGTVFTTPTTQPTATPTTQQYVPPVSQPTTPTPTQTRAQEDALRAEQAKKAVEEERRKAFAEERRKEEEEAERIRKENAVPIPAPKLVSAKVNLFDKIECRGCCSELSKVGTIIFRNFFVEGDGSISISGSSSVSIKNSKCQQGVLDAFRKNCKFSPPKNGTRYEYKSFSFSY